MGTKYAPGEEYNQVVKCQTSCRMGANKKGRLEVKREYPDGGWGAKDNYRSADLGATNFPVKNILHSSTYLHVTRTLTCVLQLQIWGC